MLLAREAGVGKTRLARDVLAASDALAIEAAATPERTPPYGPLVAALRSYYLRVMPTGLDDCGPLSRYLALLLPELGAPPEGGDRATLFEDPLRPVGDGAAPANGRLARRSSLGRRHNARASADPRR